MTLRAPILVILVLLALAPAGTSRAVAQAAQPSSLTTESVTERLMGFEDTPSIEAWRAMGPEVVPVLARIAGDPQQPGFLRLRAVQAAGAFATPSARTLLRQAIRGGDPMMAREAAIAMARAFGRASIADIAPLLAHRDSAVREGAIRALGSIDDDQARGRLRDRLARESDPVLRQQIEAVLANGGAPSGGVGARDG